MYIRTYIYTYIYIHNTYCIYHISIYTYIYVYINIVRHILRILCTLHVLYVRGLTRLFVNVKSSTFWTIRRTRAGGPASRGSVKTGSLEAGGALAIASVAFAEHRDRVGPLLLEGLSNRASGSNTGGPSQPQTRAPEAVTSAPPRF